MAEVLDAQYQRELVAARQEPNPVDSTDPLEEQEAEGQDAQRRRLAMLQERARGEQEAKSGGALQAQAEERIKKEIAKKISWRAVNIAMGAMVLLLVLTVLIWTVQFIGGNIMGSKMIPKLGMGETILWLVALFIVFAAFNAIMLAISILVQVYEDPLKTVATFGSIILQVFWGVVKGLVAPG